MSFKNIRYEEIDNTAVITIDRPERLNALNLNTFAELDEALDKAATSEYIGGLLVTGSGSKAFVAGADITEITGLSLSEGIRFSRTGQAVFDKIEKSRKPVIALVNGFALGGGCELAMACHLRIAAESAKFGQPEVNLGLIPGYGGTQRLPRLVGRGRALDLLLSGDIISAQKALEIGLVNRVVEDTLLLEEGKKRLQQILSRGPVAIEYILHVVHQGLNMSLEDGIRLEATHFGMACTTDDMKEGTTAFLEKRKADFRGK